MNVHKNARLTPHGRERIARQVLSGQTPKAVGEAAGVCPRTVRKWAERYRREGLAGLTDRSSRPLRLHRPTPEAVIEQVETLRRARRTGKQIAAVEAAHLLPLFPRDGAPISMIAIRRVKAGDEFRCIVDPADGTAITLMCRSDGWMSSASSGNMGASTA